MKYEKETLKQPPSSNFIVHSMRCKSIPVMELWTSFQAACNDTKGAEMGIGEEPVIKVAGVEAQ